MWTRSNVRYAGASTTAAPIVHHRNCIDGMSEMREGSVDLVLADPPYNIGVKGGESWDSLTTDEYTAFTKGWTAQAARILRPGGALLVWGSPNNDMLARLTLLLVDSVGMTFVQEMAWTYTSGGDGRLTTMKRYATRHERVLWFEKPGGTRYFDAKAIAEPYTDEQKRIAKMKGSGRLNDASLEIGKPPWSWWTIARVNSQSSERRLGSHPSMKPLKVAERLLLAHSPPDGTVVVPFVGSGSEMLACADARSRTCIGFETEEKYVKMASRRLHARSGAA